MTRRFALAGAVALVLGAGCITPSIPIPPPDPTAMTFSISGPDGTARFSYAPNGRYGGAIVYVYNQQRGVGVIDTAGDNGAVGPTAPFPALVGDQIIVTFELDDQSASSCVRVHEGALTTNDVCF